MEKKIATGLETANDSTHMPLILEELSKIVDDLGIQAVLETIVDFGGEATEDQIMNSSRLTPIAALAAVIELCKKYEGRYHEGLFINLLTKAITAELKDVVRLSDLGELK